MSTAIYLQITPEAVLPEIACFAPFRAVIIAHELAPPQWQSSVSEWLVRSGCLYMMAWGPGCSSWDDSVDMANIERFECNEIPEERFVMTSWHDDETLAEVFGFAKRCAFHPTLNLGNTLLLHISAENRELEFGCLFADA